jgi:hypothetical protein
MFSAFIDLPNNVLFVCFLFCPEAAVPNVKRQIKTSVLRKEMGTILVIYLKEMALMMQILQKN